MLSYLTLGVLSARVCHGAGVDTLLVDAGRLAGTFRVGSTSYLHLCARSSLGSFKARWTTAVNLVVHHGTLSRLDAWVLDCARVNAMVVVALLLRGTVKVGPTVDGEAGDARIS